MKRTLLHIIYFCCLLSIITRQEKLFAQQRPQFTQYILNNYILNPAISGIENYVDAKISHRQQWKGLEDAPVTSYFSLHLPIGKKDDKFNATSLDMTGVGMHVYNYHEDYSVSEPHHGLGILFTDDKAGQLKQTFGSLSYAYHLGLSSRINLSLGIGIGFSKTAIDNQNLMPEEQSDPTIIAAQNGKIVPDLNAGFWMYASNYFIGASVQGLLSDKVPDAEKAYTNVPHYFVTAGYKFWVAEDVSLIPSVMLKIVQPATTSVDFNAKIALKNKLWMGASYRNSSEISGMLGFNISSLIHISYSYDFTGSRSQLSQVSNGTQEIILGLTLNNKYKILQPVRFW